VLYIKCIDKDVMSSDDPMGYCAVPLDKLRPGVALDVWMKLQDVDHGEIHLVLSYTPPGGVAAAAPPSTSGPKAKWTPPAATGAAAATPAAAAGASAAAGAGAAGGAHSSTASEVTFSRNEMEAIVRAVFEDGRRFGWHHGYNQGFSAGTKGEIPSPGKLPPGTMSIPPTSGALNAGYIARMIGHVKAGVVTATAAAAAPPPTPDAPQLRSEVSLTDVTKLITDVQRLSQGAPSNRKFITKIDARVALLQSTASDVDANCSNRATVQRVFAQIIGVLRDVAAYIREHGHKMEAGEKANNEAVKGGYTKLMGNLDACFRVAAPYERSAASESAAAAAGGAAGGGAAGGGGAGAAQVHTPSVPGALGAPPPPPPGGMVTLSSEDMGDFSAKYFNPAQSTCIKEGEDGNIHSEQWGKEMEQFMARFESLVATEGG
jgi:hypothetical protein